MGKSLLLLITVTLLLDRCATQSSSSSSTTSSCEAIRLKLVRSNDANLTVKLLACQLAEANRKACAGKPPAQPCGKVFVASLPSTSNGPHVAARIVDVSQAGNVTAVCAAVGAAMLQKQGAPAPLAYGGGIVAGYNCDAMLRAAARRDPLVIFAPQAVVFKELTGDGLKVAQKVAEDVKRNIPLTALAGNVVIPMFEYNAVTQVLGEKGVASLPGITVDPEATLRNIQNAPAAIIEGVNHVIEEVKNICLFNC